MVGSLTFKTLWTQEGPGSDRWGAIKLVGDVEDIYPNQPSPYIEPVEWCSGRRVSVQVKTLGWAAGPRSGQSCTSPPARFWIPPGHGRPKKPPPNRRKGGFQRCCFALFESWLSLFSFFLLRVLDTRGREGIRTRRLFFFWLFSPSTFLTKLCFAAGTPPTMDDGVGCTQQLRSGFLILLHSAPHDFILQHPSSYYQV